MASTRYGWIVGIAIVAFSGCAINSRTMEFHEEADFRHESGEPRVASAVIETRNGSVEVRCDPTILRAEISGTKSASAVTPEAAQEYLERIEIKVERPADRPGVLRIAAEFPPEPPVGVGGSGVSFRIALPADTSVEIHTCNSHANVTGAARDVRINTSNGSIRASRIGGAACATTSNASIVLEDVAGDVEATSSNGNIEFQRVGRDRVRAHTSNGRISATAIRGAARLETSCGSVQGTDIRGDVSATTSCASITLNDVTGDVTASTSCGDIDLRRVGKTQVQARTSSASIRAVDTRGAVRLDTTCGGVTLKARSLPAMPQVHLATTGAAVNAEVPATAQARLLLKTSNDHIRTELKRANVTGLETGRDTVTADLNGGGGTIEVITANGPITFSLLDAPPATQP